MIQSSHPWGESLGTRLTRFPMYWRLGHMRITCMHHREAYVARYMYRWITVIACVVTVDIL